MADSAELLKIVRDQIEKVEQAQARLATGDQSALAERDNAEARLRSDMIAWVNSAG